MWSLWAAAVAAVVVEGVQLEQCAAVALEARGVDMQRGFFTQNPA